MERNLRRDLVNHLRFKGHIFDLEKTEEILAAVARLGLSQKLGTHGRGWHYTRKELDRALEFIRETEPEFVKS